MQSLSNYQWHFSQNKDKKTLQFEWKHKRSQIANAILRKKNGARGSIFPTSDYTTKLQLSLQYDTDTKTEI